MTDQELEQFALRIRKRIIQMAYECNSNVHLGGALSMVDILAVLYGKILRNIGGAYEERDKFILSKGHGALGLFATLGEKGLIAEARLQTYLADGSNLCAHPVMEPEIGIESSNGSLGQGISMAVGMALSAKLKKRTYQVYTIIGNGESDEGLVWEALASASQFKLDNFTVILDDNKFQNDGASEDIMYYPNYRERFQAFGFDALEIDGNNIVEVVDALQTEHTKDRPKAIIANTVKGCGISFMENDNSWHHNRLTQKYYEQAMKELEEWR
jgi:transketolase